jgi:dTMP kinase
MTYLSLAKEHLERYCLIDASLPLSEVQQAIQQVITTFLETSQHA